MLDNFDNMQKNQANIQIILETAHNVNSSSDRNYTFQSFLTNHLITDFKTAISAIWPHSDNSK